MRTNVTFCEILNELYNIFSDDRQAAAYMADSFGPQYIGLCGWAGAMSPANRAAFVQTFGRDVTDRAEAEARARVREYRAAVGIIITTTSDGFRKASFPFAALDTYLPRMVRQGMKVCICEAPRQAEPSKMEKVAQDV